MDSYKEIGNIKIIRIGKRDFSKARTMYTFDRGLYHYQFTNRKVAEQKKRFFTNRGWVTGNIHTI